MNADLARLAVLACFTLPLLGPQPGFAAAPPSRPRVDLHGDPLPPGALARLGTVRLRDSWDGIGDFAFSPDGRFLISAGGPGLLRLVERDKGSLSVWDWKTGHRVRTLVLEGAFFQPGPFPGFHSGGDCLWAFTPDGTKLATLSTSVGTLQLWDMTTGRELTRPPATPEWPKRLALSPKGKALACADTDGNVHILDLRTGRSIACPDDLKASQLAFTPDGKHLATLAWDALRWVETTTGKVVRHYSVDDGFSFALSPDGRLGASSSAEEGAWVRDIATGKKQRLATEGTEVLFPMQFSADGRSLFAINQEAETVRFWDVRTGRKVRQIKAPGLARVGDVIRLSPDGTTLAGAERWRAVRLWDARTGRPMLNSPGPVEPPRELAFSPDGKVVVSRTEKEGISRWDAHTGRLLSRALLDADDEKTPDEESLSLSPNGALVAVVNGDTVRLHDTKTGKRARTIRLPNAPWWCKPVFSPTGRTLAIGAEEGKVRQWDVTTGKEQTLIDLRGRAEGPYWLCFTTDGQALAVGDGENNDVHLWCARTGRHLRTIPTALKDGPEGLFAGHHWGASFAPGGWTLLLARGDIGLQAWDLVKGTLLPPFENVSGVAKAFATRVVPSPDGRWLIRNDDHVGLSLYEVASGKPIHRLPEACSVVAFSPDARSLATGYQQDASVLVWGLAELFQARAGRLKWAAAWDALADADTARAYRAVGLLLTDEGRALALLEERLRPVSVFPRSRLAPLLRELGSVDFARRQAATQALAEAGEGARASLEEARRTAADVEVRLRLKNLLGRLQPRAPERLREHRAVFVLERLGTPRARALLRRLAGGAADALLTREAKEALARVARHGRGGS